MRKFSSISSIICSILLSFFSASIFASTDNFQSQSIEKTPTYYEHARELKNRFRVDHMVERVTLFVQRRYGSAPVIIVLPDGSKWYANRHPESVKWVDGLSGDMITIEAPIAGPWQLIGKVTEGSTITMLTQLGIEVTPFPQPLYQGERLKITAQLMGDEQRLRFDGLDYLFQWRAKIISQHRTGDENFASGTIAIGSYKDNGEGLDERPDDGIFTGNLNLNHPWGHYYLRVNAKNNIFEREFERAFVLSPSPVALSVIKPEDPLTQRWKLQIELDEEALLLEQTHLTVDLVGPAGLQMALVIDDFTSPITEYLLPEVTAFGSYRMKFTVMATANSGREIVLSLPEQFFNLIEPPAPPPTEEELAAIAAKQAAIAEQEAKDNAIFWFTIINATLIPLGVIILIIWRKRKNLNDALAATQKRLDEEKVKAEANDKGAADVDLTMPED